MSEQESGQVSEQEKEAIELLKERKATKPYIIWGNGVPYNKSNKIDTILNYIEKIQKENQELKEELDYYKQKESQEFDERDYYEE